MCQTWDMKERILLAVAASETIFGSVIRSLTQSPVNHSFVLYESTLWGGWWATQVDEHGVQKLPAMHLCARYETLELYECVVDLVPGLRRCRSMIGAGYDFLGIIGFLFKLLVWRLLGRRILNPFHRNNREFCSEFVANVLKSANVPGFEAVDPPSLSPGDLRNIFLANNCFHRVFEPWL